jgi:hypothetical protein
VDVSAEQLATYPVEGIVEVFGERFGFTRRRTSNILNLSAENGLPFELSAGTVVLVVAATPRPAGSGGTIVRNEQGGTCAILPAGEGPRSLMPLMLGVALLVGARRLGRRR